MTLGFPGPLDAATSGKLRHAPHQPRHGARRHHRRAASARLVGRAACAGDGRQRCRRGGRGRARRDRRHAWSLWHWGRSLCHRRRANASGAAENGDLLAFHGSGIAPRGASLEFMRERGQDVSNWPPRDAARRTALAVRPRVRRWVLRSCSSGSGHDRLRNWRPPRSPTPRRESSFPRPSIAPSRTTPSASAGTRPVRRSSSQVGRRRDLATSCASRIWPARCRSSLAAVPTRSIAARSRRRSRRSWRRTAAR